MDKILVFDVDGEKLAAVEKFQDPRVLPVVAMDMMKDCDIISVATPAETHASVVDFLLEHCRPRLIFCEKPIATTLEDAKKMIDSCAQKRVKLAVNHTRRWDRVWKFAADQILGDVTQVPNMAVAHFAGDLLNVGIHMADLINWFKLGGCCEVFGHRDTEYLLFELDVFFQRKRLRVRDNGLTAESYVVCDSTRYDGIKELGLYAALDASGSPMLEACNQLVRCIYDGEAPACTGEDGLRALERAMEWEKKA